MRSGGGLGDALTPDNSGYKGYVFGRIAFDLIFWAIFNIITLNLVLGIIVDTFVQLRDERAKIEIDIHNTCFVCSLPSFSFEQVGGFQTHVKKVGLQKKYYLGEK